MKKAAKIASRIVPSRTALPYWKGGLLGFVGGALLFMLLPLPEGLPVSGQLVMLVALQAAAVGISLAIVRRQARTRFQFDLRNRFGRRNEKKRRWTVEQFLD